MGRRRVKFVLIRLALIRSALFLVTLAVLSNCGRANKTYTVNALEEENGNLPEYSSAEKALVTLALFGTPSCNECKHSHPEIQKQLNALPADLQKKLYFVLYVPEGANSGNRPTPETTEAYGKQLHIRGQVLSDDLWRKYRSFKITNETQVPAAVVINNKTHVVTKFRAGATFIPSKIVEAVQGALQEE